MRSPSELKARPLVVVDREASAISPQERGLFPAAVASTNVGLVHDYLLAVRGAERVFASLARCWPDASIYTTLYSPEETGGAFVGRRIHPSYLQHLRVGRRRFRSLLPLYPHAVENLPVQAHDVVVSSSSAFAHGVRPRPGAVHVCACHSPFRYAWHERKLALEEAPRALHGMLDRTLERIKRWDIAAARRVTQYIAFSELSQARIHDFYGRESRLVFPGVDLSRFSIGEPEDFFLVVAELVPHKRVERVLEAAALAGCKVKVVGWGPRLGQLKAAFADVAEFLGPIDDRQLADVYRRARALVVPNVEEFGLAALEAQASGRPVLAQNAGGVRHTVIDGETGVLLDNGTPVELAEAMMYIAFESFDPAQIRAQAERFPVERFQRRFKREVDRAVARGPVL